MAKLRTKTSKNLRKTQRNKKGGFFTKPVISHKDTCKNDPRGLPDRIEYKQAKMFQDQYFRCCPKNFGMKNNSPYCKKVEKLVLDARANNYNRYGDYTKQYKYNPTINKNESAGFVNRNSDLTPQYKPKPWWQFWGGKTRRRRHHK